ncbi:MAG: hypothetical protein ACI4JW_09920 [Oscillospiraceae bacterium]
MLDSIFESGQASDIVAILSKYDDEAIVAINKILDKDAVAALIRDYGDDGVKVADKSGDYIVKAVKNLDDDAAESFIKTASKQDDAFFEAIAKSSDPDKAAAFVAKYTDDGAEILTKYGDDAVTAVNNCDAPHKAIQIIKNGGTQYGEQAVQAIKKSGDKAVEVLTKVPTKECAEIISKINNNIIDLINKLDVDEAKRFLETVHKQDDSLIKI